MRLIRADGSEKRDNEEVLERLDFIRSHTRDSRDFMELDFDAKQQPAQEESATLELMRQAFFRQGAQEMATGITIDVTPEIAPSEVFLMRNVFGVATGGSGQNVTALLLNSRDGGIEDNLQTFASITETTKDLEKLWFGEIVLFPGDYVRLQAAFDADTNTNTGSLSISGVVMPRANWEKQVKVES